jgi:DNA-binding XRE family transcriptional regulator
LRVCIEYRHGRTVRLDQPSDYYPWDYCRSESKIVLLAKQQSIPRKKTRHIQPAPGPERAFGDALREIRKEHGISQEQLALDSGLDRTYVSLIERGAQSPTIRSVLKLADVLGVNPSEIVQRMERFSSKKPRLRK